MNKNIRLEKTIFHVDVNAAYLSWEAVRRLYRYGEDADLREIPAAVGGDERSRRGIILAKSIPAGAYGVKTGETIREALRKCPGLVIVPPDYRLYGQASAAFLELLRRYSPAAEPYSIDECYLDMTETAGLSGGWEQAAEEIRQRAASELGFTVNIGVSSNKLLAKMASDFQKPDRIHTLFPWEIREKMWPLPVEDLFFVGRASKEKLKRLGVHTIGQLARSDRRLIGAHLKRPGERIWDFANGRDTALVEAVPLEPKSCGNSATLPADALDPETGKRILLSLCETVGARLRAGKYRAGTVAVGIRRSDFSYVSGQTALKEASSHTGTLWEAACGLFDRLWDGAPIRHMGVWGSRLEPEGAGRQLRFAWEEGEARLGEERELRLERLDRMTDEIRLRYGADAVTRASLIGSPAGPMAGGVPE